MNRLHYGDNLEVLRDRSYFPDESVDLIYLDPPFNSNRTYNVLFKSRSGDDAQAQIEAFDDTWTWSQQTEHLYLELISGLAPTKVANAVVALRGMLGDNDVLAYLVMMAARLVELRRVLKPTGSLYLHCDPTASHYLKVLLDATFGPTNFRNEISWRRSANRSSISKIYRRAHDVIFFYAKTDAYQFNLQYRELSDASKDIYSKTDDKGSYRLVPLLVSGVRNGNTGKPWRGVDPNTRGKQGMHWITTHDKLEAYHDAGLVVWPAKEGGAPNLKYYLEDSPGVPMSDFWDDISVITASAGESLRYPTQKPIALLERIIEASSNPGDVVLDPFCGCGTAVDAAQRLGRQWCGIDVTFLAVDLIDTRLRSTYGAEIASTYERVGIPRDVEGAQALFTRNPFEFERWAVSLVDGTPNEKQVGDKGIDGVVRFPIDNKTGSGTALVSVKGGVSLNPSMVRDLVGTVEQNRADFGILITLTKPTPGMIEVARRSGDYTWPVDGRRFPKVQVLTVAELLKGKRPAMPTPFLPYLQARRLVDDNQMILSL